jgi:predicted NBD/HSP70 family sugar kinase
VTRTPVARPDTIRGHNLAVLLGHIHRDGALTRAELTQRLGLSRSTVGELVADLSQLGLVEEVVPSGGARVGRPSHVVGPHRHGPIALAVDIDIDHVSIASVGLGGAVVGRERVDYPAGNTPAEQVIDLIVEVVPRLHAATVPDAPLVGIGVSVPGTVWSDTGHIGVAPNLGWRDVAFGVQLAERVPAGLTVAVGNDADLAVLAEHQRGAARGMNDVVFLLGRVGLGAGIIANGRPVRGQDGYAGEIGHNVVDAKGPLCHCGKRGCLETYVGEGALLQLAGRSEPPSYETSAAVFADARRGDVKALRAVRRVAGALGRALAGLANTLDPECFVLGGYLADLLELAAPEVEQAIVDHMLRAPRRPLKIRRPAFGADSALLGAAELAFTDLLADPMPVAGAFRA